MAGSVKRGAVTGGEDIMAVLRGVVDRAEAVVSSAVGQQIEDQRENLRDRAEEHDGWKVPSDAIQSWEDREGNAAFGVPGDSEHIADAEAAEFGTADDPPTALIRMGVMSQVSDISWALTDRFRSEGL